MHIMSRKDGAIAHILAVKHVYLFAVVYIFNSKVHDNLAIEPSYGGMIRI